jgi:hypothetical protein
MNEHSESAGPRAIPQPLGWLGASAAPLLFPALLQLILHPVVLGAPLRTWALYWLYTFLGVVLPGTLLALRTVRWRTDGLTWIALGWAVGHAMELMSLIVTRELGPTRLFMLWIPLAYGFALSSPDACLGKLERVPHRDGVTAALAVLFAIGGVTYFSINLPEITAAPPGVSDAWFHINNAHEFRDHEPMQDPRLAGEAFNYHVHGYAASAGASIATGEALLPLLLRYSGMSCVFLLTLLLFNLGRAFGGGSVLAGTLTALLMIFPIDFFASFFAPRFAFGTTNMLYGVYLSTTTLAGHVYLAALLTLIYWHTRGLRWQDSWMLVLLAFAGAGSKAMFGPIVVSGALGVGFLIALREQRFDRRSWALLAVLCLGVLPPLLRLVFGEGSYSTSIVWELAAFAKQRLWYAPLATVLPSWALAGLWAAGFAFLILTGAIAAAFLTPKASPAKSSFALFGWLCFAAGLVPALGISLHGASQLFFLYYGIAALSPVAGFGLARLGESAYRKWGFAIPLAAAIFGWSLIHMTLGFPMSIGLTDDRINVIWVRTHWWRLAVIERGIRPQLDTKRLGLHGRKVALTPEIRAGLDWARRNFPGDSVFAVNVREASPYGAYSESRAFLETTRFHVRSHDQGYDEATPYFQWRHDLLKAWEVGAPNTIEQMRQAGITHLFEDRVNGYPVASLSGGRRAVYESADFIIHELRDGH